MGNRIIQPLDQYMAKAYTTVVREDRRGDKACYMAYHPELPGCMAQGDTWQKAVESLREARRDYISVLQEEGMPVPVPKHQVLAFGWQPIIGKALKQVRVEKEIDFSSCVSA